MNNKKKSTENLSDVDHQDMLNNDAANLQSRIATYNEYVEIGFKPDEALQMAGLKKSSL